jgi:hypothetical protein
MSRSLVRLHWPALALAGALCFAGCSAPTTPDTSSGGTPPPSSQEVKNPTFVSVPVMPTGATVAVPSPTPAPEPIDGEMLVDGRLGGVVQVGRFSLEIPPGAWNGVAEVEVRVPNPAVLACELHVSPDSLNSFEQPVVLTMDFTGATDVSAEKLQMLWQADAPEDSTRWERVAECEANASRSTLVARITHFSRYGGYESKAGW